MTDEITASLVFTEHNPPIVKIETAQAKTPTAKELAQKAKETLPGNKNPEPKAEPAVTGDYSFKQFSVKN